MIALSRKRQTEDENDSSLWLVTYSDMVTLLLSFFILMYSFSVMTDQRKQQLVNELRTVSANTRVVREQPREDLEEAAREIAAQFQKDKAFVENTETEVTVGLSSEVTFASGDAALSDAGRGALVRVAAILGKLPNTIRVEGHTDSIPVRGGRFSSNWHLSAARAQSVVRLLLENGVDARRLQVVGYGDVRPRAANETPEGRAQNRRIEIKILRKAGDAE
ncbi:OmpA family protein [Anaeromyxobacter oryzisoli]|uniref:OmpA family protein n=1 Tax=Anaeromyxobacter oryzisoli TaxID=2925408 RepID=UPI001F55CF2D|nr:OmpA family protein [Anaeromyxobacter sp. SG63]